MRKRLLAAVLTLAMCLGLSVTALASETTVYFNGYGNNYTDDTYTTRVIQETTDLTTAQLCVIGDFTGKDTMEFTRYGITYICPFYQSAAPVRVEIVDVHAPAGKISDYDLGICATAIATMYFDEAEQLWEIEKQNVMHFNGNVTVYLDDEYSTAKEVPVADYESGKVTSPGGPPVYHNGNYVMLTEPGCYWVEVYLQAIDGLCAVFVQITDEESTASSAPAAPSVPAQPAAAAPNASSVLVNGKKTAFDAYTINGNNYFKLRDLAYVLNGTGKQFEVGWDGAANAISLTSGQPYTAVGGEMTAGNGTAQNALPTSSKIFVDGKDVSLTAYTINGNNYFKLRDIGQTFNFGVDWDGAAQTIRIDTSKEYTPD